MPTSPRQHQWGCHVCDVGPFLATSLPAARDLADAHDREHHRKKPTSYFGWRLTLHLGSYLTERAP